MMEDRNEIEENKRKELEEQKLREIEAARAAEVGSERKATLDNIRRLSESNTRSTSRDAIGTFIRTGMRLPFSIMRSSMDLMEQNVRRMRPILSRYISPNTQKQSNGCNACNKDYCNCKGDVDIQLTTRIGERRIFNLLFENNTKEISNVQLSTGSFFDAQNGSFINSSSLQFSTPNFHLKPGESKDVKLVFNIAKPFVAGNTYFAQVNIEGNCCTDPIEVCLTVLQDNDYDLHQLCDPCNCESGHFFESCRYTNTCTCNSHSNCSPFFHHYPSNCDCKLYYRN